MTNEEYLDLSPEARSRVEQGVALLDRHLGPDWPFRVDRTRLDINNPGSCVLGQLFHNPAKAQTGYRLGVQALWPLAPGEAEECCITCERESLIVSHGFMAGGDVWGEYLTAAWQARIGVLQAERPVPNSNPEGN